MNSKTYQICKQIILYSSFVTLILLLILAWKFVIPAEDAIILFEYSKNLANEGIISYGNSDYPIEGATDFLWMIAISLLKSIWIDEFVSTLLISFVGVIIILKNFPKLDDKLIVSITIICTPFLYAALSGFSVIFFSAWFILTLSLFLNKSRYLYLAILILCLIRPDGVVFGAGLVIYNLLQSKSWEDLKFETVKLTIQLIVPGTIYFLWRAWYFDEFLPLPFYVKTGSIDNKILFIYIDSIKTVTFAIIPIILSVIASITLGYIATKNNKKHLAIMIAALALPIIFYSCIRLEQNVGNRFMAPIFFGGAYLISRLYGTKTLLILAFLTISLQLKYAASTANGVFSSNRENVYSVSKNLKQHHGKMLITEAGRLTYYSDWKSEDAWGLNTPRFSRELITTSDVKTGNYDLIVGHCELSFLTKNANLVHDGQKTWGNMCKNIITQIKAREYTVMLVPFLNQKQTLIKNLMDSLYQNKSAPIASCRRHDIYAISNDYEDRKEVIQLLINHGAVNFDNVDEQEIPSTGDRLCRK